jgi:hypothetical protein
MCSTHSPWCKYSPKKCSYWMAVRKKHSWNIHTFLNIFFQKQTNALCTKTSTRFHMICHKADTMNLDVQLHAEKHDYAIRDTKNKHKSTGIKPHSWSAKNVQANKKKHRTPLDEITRLPAGFRETRRAPFSQKKADKATKTAPPSSYHCCQLG